MGSKDNKQEFIKQLMGFFGGKGSGAGPCTWERVEEIRKEILTDTDDYPWRAGCEELWEVVNAFQNSDYEILKRDEKPSEDPISALIYWLEIPVYPPIEVLCAIAEGFQIYFGAQGAITLEEAFFGAPKKGVGNYAARKAKMSVYVNFEMYQSLERLRANKKGKKMPDLESMATEFLAHGKSPGAWEILGIQPDCENSEDPESFLRNYRRWKERGRPRK